MAKLLVRQDELDEARAIYERIVPVVTRQYGPQHPFARRVAEESLAVLPE